LSSCGGILQRKRAPKIVQIGKSDNEMEMILYLAESSSPDVDIIFRRRERNRLKNRRTMRLYNFLYAAPGIPPKMAQKPFRFPMIRSTLYQRILLLLRIIDYNYRIETSRSLRLAMSSWIDRLAIGVMFSSS